MGNGREKVLRRRFNSPAPIPLVMKPTTPIRPIKNTITLVAEKNSSGSFVKFCSDQDNGSENSCPRGQETEDIMLTRLRRPSKTPTKVKAIMVPVSDTFHQPKTKSSYKMIVEITNGTGKCVKLTPETRRVFLDFTKACGVMGYTSTRSQVSEKRTTIILEQNKFLVTSPPVGITLHTVAPLIPTGANSLAEHRSCRRACRQQDHCYAVGGADDSGWSVSPAPIVDAYSIVPYGTTATAITSPISHVEKPLGTARTSSIPRAYSISLAFEPADVGSLGQKIVIRESPAAFASPPSPTQKPDIGDGIVINNKFQAIYKGSRRSKRSGIYFGNNITSISEGRNPLPAANPGPQIMDQYPKMEVVEVEERKSGGHLRAHGDILSNANQGGQDFDTDTRQVNVRQRWPAEHKNPIGPNPEDMPSVTRQAVVTPKKGLPNNKRPAIKVSRRTGFHHYPTDGELRRREATAPPTYAPPPIPSSRSQGEETSLFPTHSKKAMDILGINYKDFLPPRTQGQGNAVVHSLTQQKDIASAGVIQTEKKAFAKQMVSKLGFGWRH